MKRLWTQLLLLALLLCGTAQAEVAVPVLSQRVTDLTGTLDAGQKQLLENKLAAFESGKGSQIAVLMLPSTQPETIEQFGMRVAEAWKLGRKGVDDGALLLIAKDDRMLRIEVGYGLEGALNDATAKRIVSEIITPFFKGGEFYAGIDAGLDAIVKVIDGEALPPPVPARQNRSDFDLGNTFEFVFLVFFFGNIVLRQWLGLLPSGLVVGGVIGALVWFAVVSLFWAGLAAAIAFLLSLLFGSSRGGGSSFPTGWGGGSGGGGGFGGGGFGGGGGGFGGGGASGGW
ncbi:MAG: TPM domain-containing protein [Nitrosomonadales bacterium]|nr:TPM domain-containing protein [Nitrosomonadales bacterium]